VCCAEAEAHELAEGADSLICLAESRDHAGAIERSSDEEKNNNEI
jgi:hypothetical protein